MYVQNSETPSNDTYCDRLKKMLNKIPGALRVSFTHGHIYLPLDQMKNYGAAGNMAGDLLFQKLQYSWRLYSSAFEPSIEEMLNFLRFELVISRNRRLVPIDNR